MNICRIAVAGTVGAAGALVVFGACQLDPDQETLNRLAHDAGYVEVRTEPSDNRYVSIITAKAGMNGCPVKIKRVKKGDDPDMFIVYPDGDEQHVLWEFPSLINSLEEVNRVC